jgi:hypothetical protein
VDFDQRQLGVQLGSTKLMEAGQPLPFDKVTSASTAPARAAACMHAMEMQPGARGQACTQRRLRCRHGAALQTRAHQPMPLPSPPDPTQPDPQAAASKYLKDTCAVHGTVNIFVTVGEGPGEGMAWGCDLSYDYVKINAEYTT